MNRQSQRKCLFFQSFIMKGELYTCSLNENGTRWFKYDREDLCVNKPHLSRSYLNQLVHLYP